MLHPVYTLCKPYRVHPVYTLYSSAPGVHPEYTPVVPTEYTLPSAPCLHPVYTLNSPFAVTASWLGSTTLLSTTDGASFRLNAVVGTTIRV